MTAIDRTQSLTALVLSTVAFAICFASWVINAVLVTFLASTGTYPFTETEVSWLLAAPILTGALSRVPLGILTDRYGGRIVFSSLLLAISLPMYLLSLADGFWQILIASLGFGLAGGAFAVGVGYVSVWFEKQRQGTALGVFGMGNAGAAVTTILAPRLLEWFTNHGANPEQWRLLPKTYAALLLGTAAAFYISTRTRKASSGTKSLAEQLTPLRSIVVWRLGLYYFLVFGAFVALAQWMIPYSINVYEISIAQAGLLAAIFSLPAGLIRATGGWLSDHFGARTVMYWVFYSSVIVCLILSIPKMEIHSPGEGVSAKASGQVTSVSEETIVVDKKEYRLQPPPSHPPAEQDSGTMFLPRITRWQEPIVGSDDVVETNELIARGVTNIYYPANLWMFAALVFVFGVATGIGKAGVYRLIPDKFPDAVGVVGGMVGLLGALGGFVLPLLFGYLLQWTGLWTSCWMVLTIVSLACLIWMHTVVRRIMQQEAPDLAQIMERGPLIGVPHAIAAASEEDAVSVEDLLRRVPFFHDLPEEELKELARIGRDLSVQAGEDIFHEGDAGDAFYVILGGAVRIRRRNHGGNEMVLASLGEGDFFGELALIDSKPRSATATTTEASQLFLIKRREFLTLLSRSPRMLADLLVSMSTMIRQIDEKFFESVLQKERLRAQQEIDRHRSISEMVAGVAHEINTPLGIVNHAASIITERLTPESIPSIAKDENGKAILVDMLEAAGLVQDNIARADGLIKSFKHLSVSQITDTREQIDLKDLTTQVIDLYRLKARASQLRVELVDELGGSDGLWDGYPGHYSQVLLNLLTNIDRYAYSQGSGGKAQIVLSEQNGNDPRYRVTVTDYGHGIATEDLPRVFDPFFSTGRAQGGSGLGLAIVKNLVTDSLQGDIRIESAPGEGARVFMSFPRVVSERPQTHGEG